MTLKGERKDLPGAGVWDTENGGDAPKTKKNPWPKQLKEVCALKPGKSQARQEAREDSGRSRGQGVGRVPSMESRRRQKIKAGGDPR